MLNMPAGKKNYIDPGDTPPPARDFVRHTRIPSLRSLRTFEVAGRHLNLQAAADELFVTVSAVSHQIRLLEEELATKLFKRTGRHLELSARGAVLLPDLTAIFEQLGDTIEGFRTSRESEVLNVSMQTSFAMRWFIPRLHRFQSKQPAIDIRIATHENKVMQKNTAIDCFIHYGDGNWPGYDPTLLFTERLSPVCSPTALKALEGNIAAPSDLLKLRILWADNHPDDWDVWARMMDVNLRRARRLLHFESRNLAIQAAIEGLGVALADPIEVGDDLRIGRLVQALASPRSEVMRGIYFVIPAGRATSSVIALKDWLLEELQVAAAL